MSNWRAIIVVVLCVLLFSLLLGACKNGDLLEPERDTTLVGTWDITKISWVSADETVTYTESDLNEMGSVWTLQMEDDGTLEQTSNMSGSDTLETQTGTWCSTSADQFSITFTAWGITILYEYTIDGIILELTRKNPAGNMRIDAEFTKQ